MGAHAGWCVCVKRGWGLLVLRGGGLAFSALPRMSSTSACRLREQTGQSLTAGGGLRRKSVVATGPSRRWPALRAADPPARRIPTSSSLVSGFKFAAVRNTHDEQEEGPGCQCARKALAPGLTLPSEKLQKCLQSVSYGIFRKEPPHSEAVLEMRNF